MSDAISPLDGAKYDGFVTVQALGLQGMITLRGDLGSEAVQDAVRQATGADVPGQRKIAMSGDTGAAWMSPDELLLLVPYAEVADRIAALDTALAGSHSLAVNVSDARAFFRVEGPGVREVIAKLCPVDMRREAFAPGDFRRTRMAQIPAAFWMPSEDSAQIICFRSVGEYAFNLLRDAAEPGSEVGHLG